MKVKATSKISEIQSTFSGLYPGLKIEFFSKKHKSQHASAVNDKLSPDLSISDIALSINSMEIDFSSERAVGEIEHAIEQELGLHTQILRRSNDLWLQTTVTDNWTLASQNRKGIHSTQS